MRRGSDWTHSRHEKEKDGDDGSGRTSVSLNSNPNPSSRPQPDGHCFQELTSGWVLESIASPDDRVRDEGKVAKEGVRLWQMGGEDPSEVSRTDRQLQESAGRPNPPPWPVRQTGSRHRRSLATGSTMDTRHRQKPNINLNTIKFYFRHPPRQGQENRNHARQPCPFQAKEELQRMVTSTQRREDDHARFAPVS